MINGPWAAGHDPQTTPERRGRVTCSGDGVGGEAGTRGRCGRGRRGRPRDAEFGVDHGAELVRFGGEHLSLVGRGRRALAAGGREPDQGGGQGELNGLPHGCASPVEVWNSIRTPSGTDAGLVGLLSGDARPARMAVVGIVLERRAAPRTVAGCGGEAAAALRAELRVGLRAGTVSGTSGNGERRARSGTLREGTALRSPGPGFGTERSQGFGGVSGFQNIVVGIGEFAGRAVELDLLQGAQRDGTGTQVVVRVLPLTAVFRFPIPVPLHLGSQDRS